MLALQTNSNINLSPVVQSDVFKRPLLKSLKHKPIQAIDERNIKERKASKTRNQFSYMGMVIPFQPCMWDDTKVEAAWNEAMEMVQTKMKGKYEEECINKLVTRLNNMFGRINLNTHRKSLAVTLTPDEENIIYLNFPVRPIVFFNKTVSWLDLAVNVQREPDFYYLVLNKDCSILYDYNKKQLRTVHQQKNEPCPEKLFQNVVAPFRLLNNKNEKPVFVTGNTTLVKLFCKSEYYAENYLPLLCHKKTFSYEIIQSLIKEITGRWSYWREKFIAGSILLAKKTNRLISHTESVFQALRKGADGLLLIDKRLKHQLQKPATGSVILKMANDLITPIENFLTRGNRIEITKPGLLKDFGGIALLSNTTSVISGVQVGIKRIEDSSSGELF
jgi:hypothetical protein